MLLSCSSLLLLCPPTSTPTEVKRRSSAVACSLASHTKTSVMLRSLLSRPCAHRSKAVSVRHVDSRCQRLLVHVLGADERGVSRSTARSTSLQSGVVDKTNMPDTRIPVQSPLFARRRHIALPGASPFPGARGGQPPAVSIIILHSFCAPPSTPRSAICPAPSEQHQGSPSLVHSMAVVAARPRRAGDPQQASVVVTALG